MNLEPGWHPFPNDPSQEIYWDGERWTESRPTQAEAAKVDEDPYGVKTKFGLGPMLLLALLLLVLIVGAMIYFNTMGGEPIPVTPANPTAPAKP